MNKKQMSEQDIRTKFITPAIEAGGWDVRTQVREEVTFTAGRVIVRGRLHARGKAKRADYILYYKPNSPLAIVEAKDNSHPVGGGMQQALEYAAMLDIPFVYSANGDAFLEHDRTRAAGDIETELPLSAFPTPEALWQRFCRFKGIAGVSESIIRQDYHDDGTGRTPRYYQQIAINRTIKAIARGEGCSARVQGEALIRARAWKRPYLPPC
jgi:type I restriction enzyme R subunit